MATIINVDNVTSASLPPPEINPQTVGQWHNWGLLIHYQMLKELNGDDSIAAYRAYSLSQTQKMAEMGLVPESGSNVVNQLFDIFQNASEDGGFDSVISLLQELYAEVNANDSLRNTAVCSAANIGYNSAKFWSEVSVESAALKIDWKFWIKVACADIGGGFGGSSFGPWGTVIGAVAGSVGEAL